MKNRNTWKKTVAFVMAFTLVACTMPANVIGGGLFDSTAIVAKAEGETSIVNENGNGIALKDGVEFKINTSNNEGVKVNTGEVDTGSGMIYTYAKDANGQDVKLKKDTLYTVTADDEKLTVTGGDTTFTLPFEKGVDSAKTFFFNINPTEAFVIENRIYSNTGTRPSNLGDFFANGTRLYGDDSLYFEDSNGEYQNFSNVRQYTISKDKLEIRSEGDNVTSLSFAEGKNAFMLVEKDENKLYLIQTHVDIPEYVNAGGSIILKDGLTFRIFDEYNSNPYTAKFGDGTAIGDNSQLNIGSGTVYTVTKGDNKLILSDGANNWDLPLSAVTAGTYIMGLGDDQNHNATLTENKIFYSDVSIADISEGDVIVEGASLKRDNSQEDYLPQYAAIDNYHAGCIYINSQEYEVKVTDEGFWAENSYIYENESLKTEPDYFDQFGDSGNNAYVYKGGNYFEQTYIDPSILPKVLTADTPIVVKEGSKFVVNGAVAKIGGTDTNVTSGELFTVIAAENGLNVAAGSSTTLLTFTDNSAKTYLVEYNDGTLTLTENKIYNSSYDPTQLKVGDVLAPGATALNGNRRFNFGPNLVTPPANYITFKSDGAYYTYKTYQIIGQLNGDNNAFVVTRIYEEHGYTKCALAPTVADIGAEVKTAPTPVQNLEYTGSKQELVTAGTANENSQMQYSLSYVTELNADTTLNIEDIKVGYVYHPTNSAKITLPNDYKGRLTISVELPGTGGKFTYETSENQSITDALKQLKTLELTSADSFRVTKVDTVGKMIYFDVVKVADYANCWDTAIPEATNAGDYTVYYKAVRASDSTVSNIGSVNVKIGKANPTADKFTFTAPTNLTYDGNAKSASVKTKNGVIGMGTTVSVKYKPEGGTEWSDQAPKNAGTYYVGIVVDNGDNYNASENNTVLYGENWQFTINKANLTVTANPKTITYGEAPANDGVAYSGFVNNETAETEGVLGGSLAYDYSYSQYGNVGNNYTITPSGLTSNNYEITFAPGTLTVKQKEIGIEWSNTSFTYDGDSHAPTATPSTVSLVNGDQVSITVTGGQTNASDTAYTAMASGLTGTKAGNYKLPTTGVTKEFTIAKANLTIADANKPTNANPTYNGNAQALVTAPTTRPTGCDHIEYRHEATGVLYPTAQTPKDAAKYNNTFFNQIKLFDVDTDNPMTDFSKFVVSRNEENLIVKYDNEQIATYSLTTYNALGSPSFSSSGGNHILTIRPIKVEEDTSSTPAKYYIWDATIPSEMDAGSYTVNYKFIGDANHNDSEQLTLTSTISPLQATVSAAPQGVSNLKYNTEAQTLITAGTAVNGTMKYAISNTDNAPADSSELWKTDYTDITGKDTDTYKVWYKVFANDTNHSDSAAAYIDVSIAQASALITPPTSKNPTRYSSAVQLINAGTVEDGCKIEYALGTNATTAPTEGWTENATTLTANKSGNFYVWYKVTGTENYEGVDATPIAVKVTQYTAPSKSSQTWTITMDSYEYDGTAHTPTINGRAYTYSSTQVQYTYYNADTNEELDGAPSAIGKYRVKVYADGGSSYYRRTQTATYSITDPIDANGMAKVDAFKENDTVPVSDGKIFAGWFTDETCTTAYTEDTGKAYAKFIDEKILTVKAQISSGTTANSEKTSIRFITSVDSLKYRNVGFKITFNGKTIDKQMTKVYTALNAGGKKISPKVFSEDSNYMEAYTLNNIPQSAFGKEFTVTPYYTTQDGTIVEGKTNTFTIANMIK